MDPAAAWDDLELGWRTAFTQAWIAFCKGSFPVGAALVDAEGALIAAGRNRIFDPGDEDLAGSLLAHAEVAALRHLSIENRHDDATLFSTLEPCLFCMGAVVICRVGTVRYAGADAYGGATRLPSTLNAQTSRYRIQIDGPMDGSLGRLAAAIPLVHLNTRNRWTRVVGYTREVDPELLEISRALSRLDSFRDPEAVGFLDALEQAWPLVC
jgi:tRNA(Arg) A34 adenosine deaminase TadA